jgi:hypothetical protein
MADSPENMDQQDAAAAYAPDAAAGDGHNHASLGRSCTASSDTKGSGTESSESAWELSSGIPSPRVSSKAPSPRISSSASNADSVAREDGSEDSDSGEMLQKVLIRLRHPSGDGVHSILAATECNRDTSPAEIEVHIDASMGHVQNKIREHLQMSKERAKQWFRNRRLVVGLEVYHFKDPYFMFMKVVKKKRHLTKSLEHGCFILEATLWVLPTTDPNFAFEVRRPEPRLRAAARHGRETCRSH